MQKCKSNIVWKLGPFKVYGEHFYLIEEVHHVVANSIPNNQYVLIKKCQNCSNIKDINDISVWRLKELTKEFPLAFHQKTLEDLKYYELSL